MITLEVAVRFCLLLFLLWCFPTRPGSPERRIGTFLALTGWAFGVLAQLSPACLAPATLGVLASGAAAMCALLWQVPPSAARARTAALPALLAAVGFLAGYGTHLLAGALTLATALLAGSRHGAGPLAQWCSQAVALTLRVQSVRGVVGRIENTLERFDLTPLAFSFENQQQSKELLICLELALPPGRVLGPLTEALSEIEGVLAMQVN